MPLAAKRFCSHPRCPNFGEYKGKCTEHARQQEQQRYNADTRKWYSTQDWQALRLEILEQQPICMDCHLEASTEVDHIVPHRGDYALFWDRANLQGLCGTCHRRKTGKGR